MTDALTAPHIAPGLGQIVADIEGRIAYLEPLAAELDQLRAMRNTLRPSVNGNGNAIDVQVIDDEPPAPPALEEAAAAEPPADPIPSGKDDTGRSRSRPRRPRPAAASSNAGGTIRARVLAYIEQQDGDVKVAQVAQAIGVTPAAARQHLKRLVNAGLIDAQGATASRVYRSKRSADQAAAARPQAKRTGVNGSLPDLKARVLDAIARNPGELYEHRLAELLKVDREDIAVACGELLDHGDVVLHADSCYTVNRQGGGVPMIATRSSAWSVALAAACRSTRFATSCSAPACRRPSAAWRPSSRPSWPRGTWPSTVAAASRAGRRPGD